VAGYVVGRGEGRPARSTEEGRKEKKNKSYICAPPSARWATCLTRAIVLGEKKGKGEVSVFRVMPRSRRKVFLFFLGERVVLLSFSNRDPCAFAGLCYVQKGRGNSSFSFLLRGSADAAMSVGKKRFSSFLLQSQARNGGGDNHQLKRKGPERKARLRKVLLSASRKKGKRYGIATTRRAPGQRKQEPMPASRKITRSIPPRPMNAGRKLLRPWRHDPRGLPQLKKGKKRIVTTTVTTQDPRERERAGRQSECRSGSKKRRRRKRVTSSSIVVLNKGGKENGSYDRGWSRRRRKKRGETRITTFHLDFGGHTFPE